MSPRKRTTSTSAAASLEALCQTREILISTGSGGVGKTTTAAAIGAAAARHLDAKVLVLTIDPARRLATALGLERFGNVETLVPASAWADSGVTPKGQMWAAMLDTKQSWDDLIHLHAPDTATRDAILSNPLYQNITGRFIQSHDYVAMERLYEIHSSGRYDLIIVDTPPTRNAIDFLDAPERMSDFFSSRLLRWLIAPYNSRMVTLASKPFYAVADRILGSQFLQDVAEFFVLFQSMYDGFVERADAVTQLLGEDRTSFVVVSTLEVGPSREADFFIDMLQQRKYQLGAIVLNKVLPSYLLEADGATTANYLRDHAHELSAKLTPELRAAPGITLPDSVADDDRLERHMTHMLNEIGESYLNFQLVARREKEQRELLAAQSDLCVSVPYLESDIASLAGLLALSDLIWT